MHQRNKPKDKIETRLLFALRCGIVIVIVMEFLEKIFQLKKLAQTRSFFFEKKPKRERIRDEHTHRLAGTFLVALFEMRLLPPEE